MPASNDKTGNPRMELRSDVDDLRDDIAVLKSDFATLVKDLTATGVETAKEHAANASNRVSELADKGKEQAGVAHDRLSDTVAKRPITSLAIAAGVGAIAARLLKR